MPCYNNSCREKRIHMREWRNWHTRTFKVRVGDHAGSSPASRTNKTVMPKGMTVLLFYFSLKTRFNHIFNKNLQKNEILLLTKRVCPVIITLVVKNEYICESGGIGIRARLRCVWETMRVQVPPLAPTKQSCRKVWLFYFWHKRDLNTKGARGVKRNNPVNCFVAECCVISSSVPSRGLISRQGLRSKTVSRLSHQ